MRQRLFSSRKRPIHLGPYPLERLVRCQGPARLDDIPRQEPLSFERPGESGSIVASMATYQAMLDVIRDGLVNKTRSAIPEAPLERAEHLKAFGYFNDASMVGICTLPKAARLSEAIQNPEIEALRHELLTRQTKTLASGIDLIMADLKDSMEAPASSIVRHDHAIVFLYENPREPRDDEAGCDWIRDARAHRGALRANETACVIANYLRLLGYEAKAHSASASDVCLNRLSVASGLTTWERGELVAPYVGASFGLAAITCLLDLATDLPLAPAREQPRIDPAWWLGYGHAKSARTRDPFAARDFAQGPHPFERLKRVETPTTYIDEARVARVPKRADMFARAQFGDMGKPLQDGAKGGHYVRKAAPSSAQRRALGAFVLLQDGPPQPTAKKPADPARNAANIKAACYFLGVDAVGLSRCPNWAWYSHDATGAPIDPPHDQAISMIIDQGYETMEGASGDDWISVAQSMRAYLRFSLLGGVIAAHIRSLGYEAKAHTVLDGEVLQPPLLLLSGLGEVSRIGEVILNPYLGPRLKSGVVTTTMPIAHDKPIDFGLQRFCEACNKCARECPSGAITAGPKRMFNGYEIWKSDSQKCATYRITTEGGAMCGRCMKTCPWNLEGIFAEAPFRWAASNIPSMARPLAKLDDALGRGGINAAKAWWWDLELEEDGAYRPTQIPPNRRDLQKDLEIRHEDQTLAVYPAPLAPHPWPYPFAMDREAGIEAYQALVTAEEYQRRLRSGDETVVHRYLGDGESPVLRVEVAEAKPMAPDLTLYEFRALDGAELPEWRAGAHLDIVVTPEYLRQYSLCGDPADRSRYQIAVLREAAGRGGSMLLHRIFAKGRKVFVSKPINHFELVETAASSLLMGGGIGVTPMIAFAHRLHALGREFTLHYSIKSRQTAGFLEVLPSMAWADKVQIHVSDEGGRANLGSLLADYTPGAHVYCCGPEPYMDAVMAAAEAGGFPEDARHLEYFSAPETPDYENHPFTLKLSDGRAFDIPAEKTATDILAENGVAVDVKCADGICGVCKCRLVAGAVEHRDFVLSKAQRADAIILCQSRAAEPGGVVEVDLG
ncbi:MAG: reductive dehalogenase domain-containing protein [Pseudomonadota bacterium]